MLLSSVTPHTRCRLKMLKFERIKDYLLLEEEFIKNQERLKPQEEKNEVNVSCIFCIFLFSALCVLKCINVLFECPFCTICEIKVILIQGFKS